jgi:hypothetical protein
MIAMIATTIINSINVKPLFLMVLSFPKTQPAVRRAALNFFCPPAAPVSAPMGCSYANTRPKNKKTLCNASRVRG